jgi:ABC-type cobalamin transport system permease subunit
MTRTPAPVIRQSEVESAADRAAIHEIIRGVQANCARHEARFSALSAQADEARELLTRVKFAAYLTVLLLGAALAGGRWIVRHAVTDALVEHGLIKVSHPAAMLGAEKGGG